MPPHELHTKSARSIVERVEQLDHRVRVVVPHRSADDRLRRLPVLQQVDEVTLPIRGEAVRDRPEVAPDRCSRGRRRGGTPSARPRAQRRHVVLVRRGAHHAAVRAGRRRRDPCGSYLCVCFLVRMSPAAAPNGLPSSTSRRHSMQRDVGAVQPLRRRVRRRHHPVVLPRELAVEQPADRAEVLGVERRPTASPS